MPLSSGGPDVPLAQAQIPITRIKGFRGLNLTLKSPPVSHPELLTRNKPVCDVYSEHSLNTLSCRHITKNAKPVNIKKTEFPVLSNPSETIRGRR